MATAALTVGHVRVNDSNANTGWGNYNKGGGAPAAEGQIAYQGSPRLAVGTKVNATTDREGVTYDAGTTQDVSAGDKLVLLKVNVSDNADVDPVWGVEVAIGSAEGAHYEYVAAGSAANNDAHTFYNAVGGIAGSYLFLAIDPSVAEWRELTVGSPVLTAVDFYAVGAEFVDGQAKSENVAMDAIDIGTGLTYTGATFSFQDAIDFDQDTEANRYGWAAAVGSVLFLRGVHVVSATGIDTSTVIFPDGYHSTGLFGITANSTDLTLAGSYECLGRAYTTTDTRGDLICTGTGDKLTGSFKNWRLIELNSTAELTGVAECAELTQAGGLISGATVTTRSLAGVATLDDPDFTNLDNTDFIQGESGHAIEITTPGTYTLSAIGTSGYGADGTTSAFVYNNSGGAVTLALADGTVTTDITVRNGAGASTTLENTVTLRVVANDSAGSPIAGARVYLVAAAGGPETVGVVLLEGITDALGVVETTAYNFLSNQPVTGRVRKGSVSPLYKTAPLGGSIDANGYSQTVFMTLDE